MTKNLLGKCFIQGILLVILACCAVSCSRSIPGYSSLSDQGILAVSDTNPYLGSNMLLAQEAERSPVFLRFLRERGAPKAIQVKVGPFKNPELVLYYPESKSYYLANWEERRAPAQWITAGPFGVTRRDYRELAKILKDTPHEPVFILWGRPYQFKAVQQAKAPAPKVLIPKLPPPKPKPKPKRVKKKSTAVKKQSGDKTVVKSPLEFTPLNSDQQAIQISKGYAPRDKNGDIIHPVKNATETLGKISKWYTGATDHIDAIREANGLSEAAKLTPGQKIRVPVKLIKNLKILPKDYN